MAFTKYKRSAVPGKVPTIVDLAMGEFAINTYDGKLYMKKNDGTESIVDITAGGGGGGSGTVTSVAASGGTTGLSFTGSPITTSGTLTLGGTLNVLNGGTGATTLTSGYLLKGNGTSAVSASVIRDDGTHVSIGGAPNSTVNFHNVTPISGGTSAQCQLNQATIQSDVTAAAYSYRSLVGTAAATFTLNNLLHFAVGQAAFGAGSTINNQSGYNSDSTLVGATNNFAFRAENTASVATGKSAYAFYSAVNTATGGGTTWSFYSAGTARNYFNGGVSIGTTADPGAGKLLVANGVLTRVNAQTTTTSPWAWNSDSYDQQSFSALANALTINADAGTPTDGQKAMFRFKDNGTARALTWTTGTTNSFRAIGVTLPTTTVISKTVYVGCVYNAADSRWDAVAVAQEA